MYVIETNKLTKKYGRARGISDINLQVQEGEIFGFIGPNGAGKSTTIRVLLNLIFPTSGTAAIMGLDCVKQTKQIKQQVGYLPGEVNYYGDMRIMDLFRYSAGFYRKDCSKRTKELISLFEVDPAKKIDSLSLGNKKKLGIIQALLHEPRLLILDEPSSGLDPLMQKIFFDVLQKENAKGATIFFSSHVLNEVQKLCHRVAIIKEGRILKVEEIEKLRRSQFKKINIEYSNEKYAQALPEHSVNFQSAGRSVQFLYNGAINDLIRKLAETGVDNLWIEEPSLEEIFMHYYEKRQGK